MLHEGIKQTVKITVSNPKKKKEEESK